MIRVTYAQLDRDIEWGGVTVASAVDAGTFTIERDEEFRYITLVRKRNAGARPILVPMSRVIYVEDETADERAAREKEEGPKKGRAA